MSQPSTRTTPDVGRVSPAIMVINVLLPFPDLPTMATKSPYGIELPATTAKTLGEIINNQQMVRLIMVHITALLEESNTPQAWQACA